MTTWGFIGSGNIGSTVAGLAVAAGHNVVMSNSRGPETLRDLVAELGPLATAGTVEQAAAADVVVVTIPLQNYRDVPVLRGKVVIDTMNYYPGRDGAISELDNGSTTSSELLAAHLPESHVVKAFNNIFFQHLAALARPRGPERSALPIAGDDAAAKEAVRRLLDQIGYDAVDLGPLSEGWRSQPDTPVYGLVYAADPQDWSAGGKQASAGVVAQAAGRA